MNLDQTALELEMLQERTATARPFKVPPQVVMQSDPSLEIPWKRVGDWEAETPAAEPGWVGELVEMMASAYTPVGFHGSSRMERFEEVFFRGLLAAGVWVLSYWIASTYLAPGMF